MQSFTFRAQSLTGQTAWQDLIRLMKDEAASELAGKLVDHQIKGRSYLYDRYRLGSATRERYLGEDTPELRNRLARSQDLQASRQSRRTETARLVRLLRSEGYLTPDLASGQILQAMARIGVFRLGGTVVGTHAFRSYEGVLGIRIGADQAAQTNDIDIAKFEHLSLALNDIVEPPSIQCSRNSNLRPFPLCTIPAHGAGSRRNRKHSLSSSPPPLVMMRGYGIFPHRGLAHNLCISSII